MTDLGTDPSGLTELRDDFGDRWQIAPYGSDGLLGAECNRHTLAAEGAQSLRRMIEDYEAGRYP